jgi:hypothetical protein
MLLIMPMPHTPNEKCQVNILITGNDTAFEIIIPRLEVYDIVVIHDNATLAWPALKVFCKMTAAEDAVIP